MEKVKFNNELMDLVVDRAQVYWDAYFSSWLIEKNDFVCDLTNDFWNDHVIVPAYDRFKDKWNPSDIEDSDFPEFYDNEMEPVIISYFNRLNMSTLINNLLIYSYNRGLTDHQQPYL